MPGTDVETRLRTSTGYSARIRLDLEVNGHVIPLAQMGHDRVILAAPFPLTPGPAQTVLYVDGVPRRSQVQILPHEPGSLRIPISRCSSPS